MTAAVIGYTRQITLITYMFGYFTVAWRTGLLFTKNVSSSSSFSYPKAEHWLTDGYLDSHLKPGGYIEHSEINPVTRSDDGTIVDGDTFDYAGKLAVESGVRAGKAMDVQARIKDMIVKAGFADVVEHTYKWPLGDWPSDPRLKEIGAINARHWIEGVEAWTMRLLTQNFNVSIEQGLSHQSFRS